MANQNRAVAGYPREGMGQVAAPRSPGSELPAPEAITRIMLRPLASSLPLAAFALYGGLALLLEDGASETVLPLGRRGRARPRWRAASATRSSTPSGNRASGVSSDLCAAAGQTSGGHSYLRAQADIVEVTVDQPACAVTCLAGVA
jgi:hypothetical protein